MCECVTNERDGAGAIGAFEGKAWKSNGFCAGVIFLHHELDELHEVWHRVESKQWKKPRVESVA